MNTPYELFGWEIGPGWRPLVSELIETLKRKGWAGAVLQIKEKFGGLRFYATGLNAGMYADVDAAEEKSFTICEDCGAPGKLRSGGWLRTLCDAHHKKESE